MTKLDLKRIVYISVLLTFGFYLVSQQFPWLDFWKYSFVAFGVFIILYALNYVYENYLWNSHFLIRKVFAFLGFQEYPNIIGTWEMTYFSSYKYDWNKSEYKTISKGRITINKIEGGFFYKGNFDKSHFKSTSNYFERNRNNSNEWILGYKYINDPEETDISGTGFVSHCGVAVLNFDNKKPKEIEGFYGNNENRKTRGKIILKRK